MAPLLNADSPRAIPGKYIVVLKEEALTAQAAVTASVVAMGGSVHYEYTTTLRGFAATLSGAALEALRQNPAVAYIEADQVATIVDDVTADAVQQPATWGLDRIDQRNLPLNNTYTYVTTGRGVSVYVIDTGIRRTHREFGGRAFHGFSAFDDGWGSDDCNGHGTHVAGTIGGATYGVAKEVRLYAVRVLDCNGSGSYSGIIAGVDWVTQNAHLPAVANMSLGGGASAALDQAVRASVAAGVVYAVAAGNDNASACAYSPARVAEALTVGATTSSDRRSSFSNYGTCVNIFAPGSNIESAWYTSNTAVRTLSGTSMASPHVAGVAALYLADNPEATPSHVFNALINGATPNKVVNAGPGSPNRLLYSLLRTGAPPPTATPSLPTATPVPPSEPCPAPPWAPETIYWQGDVVSHNGRLWRAKWWTQGEEPGTTGQWGVWEDVGPCDGGAPLPTPTPPSTPTPEPPAPTPTPMPPGPTATLSPGPQDELHITYTTLLDDGTTFEGRATLRNPNAEYVWNGSFFAVRAITFRTSSQVQSIRFGEGGSPTFTVDGDLVRVDLGYKSLFPLGASVDLIIRGTKQGNQPVPTDFRVEYVRGNVIYPTDVPLPASWYPGKQDLMLADLIADPQQYYDPVAVPIQDTLMLYNPPSPTQVQIGLASSIGYPVNGSTDARVWIPTKYMAMGLAFAQERFGLNPNYLAALSIKENWGAAVTQDPSFNGQRVVLDGQEWIWPIVIDHPDGPYQVETGNFNDLVKFFPDYFPPNATHDDYTKVSTDMADPHWVTSAAVAAISLMVTREMLNAVPGVQYNEFMANAQDPWAEMAVLTFAYNRGMGSLEAKKLFSDNRQAALRSTDIAADFDMGGFAAHVPTVRAITAAMNNETANIYDAQLSWSDVETFFAAVRTHFFANGVPTDAEWAVMMEDVQRAFNVLAGRWGGSTVSFRYDFLTLLRVAEQHWPAPKHPRPTGEDWYYRVGNLQP